MKKLEPNSATKLNTQASPACFVCHKQIVDSQWFCRLPQESKGAAESQGVEVLLCSPVCALRYLGDSQPGGNSIEPNYDGYEPSRPVAEGQKPAKATSARNSRENSD
jgi:hypothetical protein